MKLNRDLTKTELSIIHTLIKSPIWGRFEPTIAINCVTACKGYDLFEPSKELIKKVSRKRVMKELDNLEVSDLLLNYCEKFNAGGEKKLDLDEKLV